MYCLNMLAIALELAREDPAYEDVASKFFEHFVYIATRDERPRRRGHRAVGRAGRLLLRRPAPSRRRPHPDARSARWSASSRSSPWRRSSPTSSTAFPASSGGCSGSSTTARTSRATSRRSSTDDGHAPLPLARRPRPPRARPRVRPRPGASSSRTTGSARSRASTGSTRTSSTSWATRAPRRLRARRVVHRPLRRQLELAGADLVPRELPHHRVAPEVPPLLRRLVPGRVPDGLGTRARPCGRSPASSRAASTRIFLRDESGRRPVYGEEPRRSRPIPTGATRPLLRVLPRRQRRRDRREPPDRLDRPRREADPAERRMTRCDQRAHDSADPARQ